MTTSTFTLRFALWLTLRFALWLTLRFASAIGPVGANPSPVQLGGAARALTSIPQQRLLR